MRVLALVAAAALCTIIPAPAANACGYLLSPRLPGETDAQLFARTRRAHQDGLRARADSVFLAQVSAARMIGDGDAEYSLTPFFPLYDTALPPQAVTTWDSPMSKACEVEPELAQVYVVYAERLDAGWRVIEIIRHGDLQDPPPGMPTAREMARGRYALPTYPE
jgi:hypothetical protein